MAHATHAAGKKKTLISVLQARLATRPPSPLLQPPRQPTKPRTDVRHEALWIAAAGLRPPRQESRAASRPAPPCAPSTKRASARKRAEFAPPANLSRLPESFGGCPTMKLWLGGLAFAGRARPSGCVTTTPIPLDHAICRNLQRFRSGLALHRRRRRQRRGRHHGRLLRAAKQRDREPRRHRHLDLARLLFAHRHQRRPRPPKIVRFQSPPRAPGTFSPHLRAPPARSATTA